MVNRNARAVSGEGVSVIILPIYELSPSDMAITQSCPSLGMTPTGE